MARCTNADRPEASPRLRLAKSSEIAPKNLETKKLHQSVIEKVKENGHMDKLQTTDTIEPT